MISYSKALSLIEKIPFKLKNEKISTINSINRVSAENVLSPNNNPLSNNAAFDGSVSYTHLTLPTILLV